MSDPKLHHYVPKFYLRRFANAAGNVYVWDKALDRSFRTSPRNLAAEQEFYWHEELAAQGHDPLTMEKQFSAIEGETAQITSQWLAWLPDVEPGQGIPIPEVNREIVSQFMALQVLRTLESRTLLGLFVQEQGIYKDLPAHELRTLHLALLWHLPLVNKLKQRFANSTWIFGINKTAKPFLSSDNPIAFRTGDNRMWLKVHAFNPGTYVVYPLAPNVVMYCHPKEPPWLNLDDFADCRSPVDFSSEFVQSENSGQVFMASRFLFSSSNDFEDASAFLKSMGENLEDEEI